MPPRRKSLLPKRQLWQSPLLWRLLPWLKLPQRKSPPLPSRSLVHGSPAPPRRLRLRQRRLQSLQRRLLLPPKSPLQKRLPQRQRKPLPPRQKRLPQSAGLRHVKRPLKRRSELPVYQRNKASQPAGHFLQRDPAGCLRIPPRMGQNSYLRSLGAAQMAFLYIR